MFSQVLDSNKMFKAKIRVDANGGWSTEDALEMIKWLSERGVEYIEQPLEEGQEKELKYLIKKSVLPIYADESCRFSEDVNKLANCVDGVNMKLMKCGGITSGRNIANIALLNNIDLMWGCNDESIISISAALNTALSFSNTKYLDLDGSLDLAKDLVTGGFNLKNGIMKPLDKPGLGVELI